MMSSSPPARPAKISCTRRRITHGRTLRGFRTRRGLQDVWTVLEPARVLEPAAGSGTGSVLEPTDGSSAPVREPPDGSRTGPVLEPEIRSRTGGGGFRCTLTPGRKARARPRECTVFDLPFWPSAWRRARARCVYAFRRSRRHVEGRNRAIADWVRTTVSMLRRGADRSK